MFIAPRLRVQFVRHDVGVFVVVFSEEALGNSVEMLAHLYCVYLPFELGSEQQVNTGALGTG